MFPLSLYISLFLSLTSLSTQNHCLQKPLQSQQPCPPFNTSQPPFPFSTTQGCGHPSFHIHCSSPFSLIKINNLTFSLITFDFLTSSSLTISPYPFPLSKNQACPSSQFPLIPLKPINFSNSPFTVSDGFCSRLSLLKPCVVANTLSPACSHCSKWHCSLAQNPSRVMPNCGSNELVSEQGCQSDVLGFLNQVLKIGIQVEFDRDNDEYFTQCESCRVNKNGICGFNSSDPHLPFLCFVDEISTNSISHRRRLRVFFSVFVSLSLICFFVIGYIFMRNKKMIDNLNVEDPTTLFLTRHCSSRILPPVFSYEELEASTNRFDPKRKIGDGGFGSVYLGQLYDGRIVAVKYLHSQPSVSEGRTIATKSFCNEILILSSIDHQNLVKLHGYCSDPRGLLLVYDYIANGSLTDHLHGSTRKKGLLNWQTRVDIALQIAIAMEYLHFTVQPPVVHRDITSANIFVDQNMRIRVGDFGLSRLLICPDPKLSGELLNSSSSGCVWTGPQGTPGYLDPDYHKSFRLTEKSDVYSYGVVLLEMITGMKAVDQRREKREVALVDMVVVKIQLGLLEEVVDPFVAAEGAAVMGESLAAVAELAFRCVAVDKDDRPDAREVVVELRRIWSRARGVRGSNSNVMVVPAAAES